MDYKRFENESDEELIYRVCSEKEKIGTWEDVAEILNGLLDEEYTSDKYRKQFQSFTKMLEANQSKFVTDSTYLEQIRSEKEALQKERIKLQTLNVERSRLDRAESRQELYYQYVGSVVQSLPMPKLLNREYSDNRSDVEYVVCLADVHYGATFKSANNEYSPEIATDRFSILLSELVDFVRDKNISHINVVSLGDLIQGILRLKDLKLNDSTIVKSTVEISRLIATFLNELSSYVDVTYYHVPNANHTQLRVLGAKANELGDEDLEYLIGNYIKDLCRDNYAIEVVLADDGNDYIETSIACNNIIMLHGHQIKSIPNALQDLSMLYHKFYDCAIMGHFHSSKEFTSFENSDRDAETLIASSFIGSDPYSDSLYKGSKSAVKIYGFSTKGHISTNKIVLN